MKPMLSFSVLFSLFLATPGSAMISVANVTKDVAKEMGIVVRSKAYGLDLVSIELQFKAEGRLKDFDPNRFGWVQLRINEGEKPLLIAPLQVRQTSPGAMLVSFSFTRTQLKDTSLMVATGGGSLSGIGYLVKLADFVDLEKFDQEATNSARKRKTSEAGDPPAASSAK